MRIALMISFIFMVMSCAPKEHESKEDVVIVLNAIKFHDTSTLVKKHIENTDEATFCNPKFKKIWTKVQSGKNAQSCKQIEAIHKEQFRKLDESKKLLTSMLRHVCEVQDATCTTYSAMLFQDTIGAEPWYENVKDYKIKKLIGDEREVIVYVQFRTQEDVKNRTLRFKKKVNMWYLAEGLR